MTTQLNPYLNFPDGTCAEAMAFYAKALHAEVAMKMTFGESPMPCSDEHKTCIMHIAIKTPTFAIMASDCPPGQPYVRGSNVSLSLNFPDAKEQDRVWTALLEGGKALMPITEQFWDARFGMLEDKFGTLWMLNSEGAAKKT